MENVQDDHVPGDQRSCQYGARVAMESNCLLEVCDGLLLERLEAIVPHLPVELVYTRQGRDLGKVCVARNLGRVGGPHPYRPPSAHDADSASSICAAFSGQNQRAQREEGEHTVQEAQKEAQKERTAGHCLLCSVRQDTGPPRALHP